MNTNQNIIPIPEEQLERKELVENTEEPTQGQPAELDLSDEESLLGSESELGLDLDAEIEEEEADELDEELDAEDEANAQQRASYAGMNAEELLAAFNSLLNAKPISSIRRDVDAIKAAFYKQEKQEAERLRRSFIDAGGNPEEYQAPERTAEKRLKELLSLYREKRTAYTQQLEAEKEENYKKKLKLIDELKDLIEAKEDLNRTFTEFHEIQRKWKEIGPVPQGYTRDMWDTYNHHVEIFYDYIKINRELRDLDLKKNLELKLMLCEKVEELDQEKQIVIAFRKLQKYHEQWREIGPVPREFKDTLWERFKEATAIINKKHQEFFEGQKEEQQKNYDAKVKLCEQVEELNAKEPSSNKELSGWLKKVLALQKEWKTIGHAGRKENAKLYERFRSACDTFFAKKREVFGEVVKQLNDNLQLKLEICAKAEDLAQSEDWKKTTDELIALQKRWKEIGNVPRKVAEETWQRFRKACDTFFERKAANHSIVESGYAENLQKKEELIREVQGYEATGNGQETIDQLKQFQQRWNEIGFVPIKEKDRVQKAFKAALDKHYKNLRSMDADRKMSKFKSKIEASQAAAKGGTKVLRSEREKLFNQIRQLEADVTLWENNIGFFAKSKNAELMIAEVRRKIEQAKEEIATLEEKIRLIDQQYESTQE